MLFLYRTFEFDLTHIYELLYGKTCSLQDTSTSTSDPIPLVTRTILSPILKRVFSREEFPQTRFVYLIGPTCVGKGFLIRLLLTMTLRILIRCGLIRHGIISFGDIIKDLLETNPRFKAAYGAMVKAGDLIPDHEAILIFETKIDELARSGMPNLIIVDGFCRSPKQIMFAVDNGYLAHGDKVFMIEADESTCLARFMHRCENKPDGRNRIDAELPTFHKRYREHQAISPKLRELFRESDCIVTEVDGNPDIQTVIFPKVDTLLEDDIVEALKGQRYVAMTVSV